MLYLPASNNKSPAQRMSGEKQAKKHRIGVTYVTLDHQSALKARCGTRANRAAAMQAFNNEGTV
jgi:hypothetical protein